MPIPSQALETAYRGGTLYGHLRPKVLFLLALSEFYFYEMDITPHVDHKSPATSLPVASTQAKAFDLKLTIRKTSINLSLRNNKNIKSTREQPSSDFLKLESPNTVCIDVPKLEI